MGHRWLLLRFRRGLGHGDLLFDRCRSGDDLGLGFRLGPLVLGEGIGLGAGGCWATVSALAGATAFGFCFDKAKIPPTPATWIAKTRMKAVVNEIPSRFFFLIASRYSGSSIQWGCFVGYVVFVFIAASYAAFLICLQIAHP